MKNSGTNINIIKRNKSELATKNKLWLKLHVSNRICGTSRTSILLNESPPNLNGGKFLLRIDTKCLTVCPVPAPNFNLFGKVTRLCPVMPTKMDHRGETSASRILMSMPRQDHVARSTECIMALRSFAVLPVFCRATGLFRFVNNQHAFAGDPSVNIFQFPNEILIGLFRKIASFVWETWNFDQSDYVCISMSKMR